MGKRGLCKGASITDSDFGPDRVPRFLIENTVSVFSEGSNGEPVLNLRGLVYITLLI